MCFSSISVSFKLLFLFSSHQGSVPLSLTYFVSLYFSLFHLIINYLSLATMRSIAEQAGGGVGERWQIASESSSTHSELSIQ